MDRPEVTVYGYAGAGIGSRLAAASGRGGSGESAGHQGSPREKITSFPMTGAGHPVPMASSPVPVRTILATIGLVLATYVALELVVHARRVLIWVVIALLLAVSLHPAVEALQRRMPRCRRSVATLPVFLAAAVAVAAVVALFVIPLAQEGSRLPGRLPAMIRDAQAGRGPVGNLLERTHALQYVQRHQVQIRAFATGLTTAAVKFVRGAATTATGALTIFVWPI